MKKYTLLLSALLFSSITYAEQLPIKIQEGLRENIVHKGLYYKYINIVSLTDEIIIDDVIVNRGNCQKVMAPTGNKKLHYGQSIRYEYPKSCQIMEITVTTNKGSGTYSKN
ncbi:MULTISPECIES: hypothetical protein [Morganella]|uniref:hypothetical protein n=1 Tax=Morganella TaxID=581 RepID=UPI000468DD84|nr:MULTISPECIES: hypothetical protein [Morganella]MDH0356646.1 hypothetical protein [Morganella sp. GD04133]